MTKTIRTIETAHALTRSILGAGQRIALVPTMGALHAGHLSLIKLARDVDDIDAVVVSIFVNPRQFGPGEDLDVYPRQLALDSDLATAAGATHIFAPSAAAMYSSSFQTSVKVRRLTSGLCGTSRPGHFNGVTTVVSKLFNLFYPHVAVFGQKDFQQLAVIRQMVSDMGWPVDIVGAPIVREADGLALSSRNQNLTQVERATAPEIYRAITLAQELAATGKFSGAQLERRVRSRLSEVGLTVDYVTILDDKTLEPNERLTPHSRIFVAAFAGDTRLIDNLACPFV